MGGVPPLLAAEGEWTPPLAAGGTERALGAAARAWGGVEEYDEEEDEGGAELARHREYQDEMPSDPSLL